MTSRAQRFGTQAWALRQARLLLRNTFTQARCKEPENTLQAPRGWWGGFPGGDFWGREILRPSRPQPAALCGT